MKEKRSFKKYSKKAEELLKDGSRVSELMDQAGSKLQSLIESNEKLSEFSSKIYKLIRMIKAQLSGNYTELPLKTMALIVGGIIYFVTPVDLIPDFIPALGFTDDLAIIMWIYKSLSDDIERFEMWEKELQLNH